MAPLSPRQTRSRSSVVSKATRRSTSAPPVRKPIRTPTAKCSTPAAKKQRTIQVLSDEDDDESQDDIATYKENEDVNAGRRAVGDKSRRAVSKASPPKRGRTVTQRSDSSVSDKDHSDFEGGKSSNDDSNDDDDEDIDESSDDGEEMSGSDDDEPVSPRRSRRTAAAPAPRSAKSSRPANSASKKRQPQKNLRQTKGAVSTASAPKARAYSAGTVPERPNALPTPATDLARARARLHVGAVPDSLPCRETEFCDILGHLANALEEGSGTCLYVSGVPGTGKTATFYATLRTLQKQMQEATKEADDEEDGDAYADASIPSFDFVEINAMKLTEPQQAYVALWQGLTGAKVSPRQAEELLNKRFSTYDPNRRPCIVLLDELDVLANKKQTVMYDFCNWPNLEHARLAVVAIANTMDLPERMLSNKVSSRLGLTRISFQPYTHDQLIEIVESRLAGIRAFDPKAIELCARRVAAVSGDARRALDMCRRAVEIVENNTGASQSTATTPGLVQMKHVDEAVREMHMSPVVQAIRRVSDQQRLVLASIIRVGRSTGSTEVEFGHVAEEHMRLCGILGKTQLSVSALSTLCGYLGSFKLILSDPAAMGHPDQKMRLNVNPLDIVTATRLEREEALFRLLSAS